MASPSLNFITFNQDYTCLAVGESQPDGACSARLGSEAYKERATGRVVAGTSRGFRIYHTDPFSRIYSSDDGNIAVIEMLFSTSLVALILSPRHLIIQNTKVLVVLVLFSFWGISIQHLLTTQLHEPESVRHM